MKRPLLSLTLGALLLLFLASQCIFFVEEGKQALVLQLGNPLPDVYKPGLHFKLPFIQNVMPLENRIILFSIPKTPGITADQKAIEIDSYACWRITDPHKFVATLRVEAIATERLSTIVQSQLHGAIGRKPLMAVVSEERNEIIKDVLSQCNAATKDYGVEVKDVRIKRTELPNRESIFKRMNAERVKMANEYRFKGESEKLRIRSEAERTRDKTLAEANKDSITIRGQADAESMRIFAEALSTSPEFYEFSKSLEIYRKAFKEKSKIVFSTDDPLLRFLQ